MRTSMRWFDVKTSKRVFTPIPFVSKSGKFSVNTLCYWTAYPEQIVATLSSTVLSRLKKIIARRFSWRYCKENLRLLAKISFLYTVTHSDYLMDRFLGILKRKANTGLAHRFLYHSTCKLGEDDRFVYNQLCNMSLWLSFRCRTCKRDKPSMEKPVDPLSWFNLSGENSFINYNKFRQSTITWKTAKARSSKRKEFHTLPAVTASSSVCSLGLSELSDGEQELVSDDGF